MSNHKNTLRKKAGSYFIGSADVINNPNLSWKAKGLHGYLNSKPDGWQFYVTEIQSRGREGGDAVRTGLVELEKAGYLKRTKRHGESGTFEYDYEVFNEPQLEIGVDMGHPDGNKAVEISEEDVVGMLMAKPAKPTIEFERDFWDVYNKKVDRAKCERAFNKLSTLDKLNVKDHVPEYVKATPDKQYRKNPLTYINSRTWEDEELPNQFGKMNAGHGLHDHQQNSYNSTSFKVG